MATNGICKIRVKGTEYPLYFNIQAVEELSDRVGQNKSSSPFKIMSDMIYAGMVGHAAANDLPYPDPKEVYKLCEDFKEEKDGDDQYTLIDKCYCESLWGKRHIEKMQELKKKLDTLIAEAETKPKPQSKPTTGKRSKNTA